MPQLGESVTEGTIERWLVKEGDTVEQYDPLFEVVTDKVNAEVPAEVPADWFSHGFGDLAANQELVAWLRAHNAARPHILDSGCLPAQPSAQLRRSCAAS